MTQTMQRTSIEGEKGKTVRPTRVFLEGVRISYVALHAPRMNEDEKGNKKEAYQVRVLIPKTRKEQIGRLKQAVYAAKAGAGRPPEETYKNAAVRDGDKEKATREADGKSSPELAGMYFLTARSPTQPMCLTKERVQMVDARQIRDTLYPGCVADVLVTAFYYPADGDLKKTQGGRGVSWTVDAVIKRADAKRLDGRATINDLPPASMVSEQEIFADYGLEPEAPADIPGGNLSDDDPF